jgi:hypothetical protein
MRVCVGLVGFALVLLISGCAQELTLPEDLIGTYTTSAPNYSDRSVELTPDEIVFGLGDAGLARHDIESVFREEEGGKMLYTLAYAGEDGTDHLLFFHDEENGGSIVLRNQTSIVWNKQGVER